MRRKRGRFSRIVLALAGGAALVEGGVYLLTAEQRKAAERIRALAEEKRAEGAKGDVIDAEFEDA